MLTASTLIMKCKLIDFVEKSVQQFLDKSGG